MFKRSLQYIKNTNENATLSVFLEDHEPIGAMLWRDLSGLATLNEKGCVVLTEAGEKALND